MIHFEHSYSSPSGAAVVITAQRSAVQRSTATISAIQAVVCAYCAVYEGKAICCCSANEQKPKAQCDVESPEEIQLFSNNSEARCLADVQAGFADKVAGVEHVLHLLAQVRQLVRGCLYVILILQVQGVTVHTAVIAI